MRIPRTARLAAAGTAVVVALALGAVFAFGGRGNGGENGQRAAPTFSLPEVRDPATRIELTDYRSRPVVLNFWASWCVPCRKEMPSFEAVHQRFGEQVVVLGVNHQDGRTPARDFLGESGVTYPSGSDPEGKVAAAYGLRGMPSTVFISSAGQIVATRTGELSRSQLEDMIEELLAEQPDRSS